MDSVEYKAVITITTPFEGNTIKSRYEMSEASILPSGLVDTIQYHKERMVREQYEYRKLYIKLEINKGEVTMDNEKRIIGLLEDIRIGLTVIAISLGIIMGMISSI